MERHFQQLLSQHTPPTNRDVCEGLACTYIPLAPDYVDSVFRSACRSFPALEYLGYERCTPQEEFLEITKPKNNRRTYNLAESNIYLVKYFLRYKGKDLPPKYVFLPYVKPGGLIMLSGSCYHLTPVLTDKVISPGTDSVFVRLLRDKINFQRCYHTIVIDDCRETTHVVWAKIYRKTNDNKKIPTTTKANSAIVHYLLAQHGFSEMFKTYVGFCPILGTHDITPTNYPPSDWVICRSTQMRPKTYLGEIYQPTDIRLAIPRELWNETVKSFVAGFYYVVDHFPTRIDIEYIDRKNIWLILLGHIIFSGAHSEGRLHEQTMEHFNSLNEYIDIIIVNKLQEIGYNIDNFFSLLGLIVIEFNNWIIGSAKTNTSLYGKSLEILYFALFDITSAIFRTIYRLTKQSLKKDLSEKDVMDILQSHLKPRGIFGLTRSNIVANNVSYSGDNMYPKITSVVAQQKTTTGAKRGKKTRTIVDESKRLHTSMVEAGSLLFLTKSCPTPAARINPFIHLDLRTSTIIPNPKFKDLLESTEEILKGTGRDNVGHIS